MATAAIEVAATLSKGTSAPELRGFRGFHEVQRTEVAFTSLACRALDRFLFSDQAVGACLHQAPCRKRTNNPERPDMYIVPFPEKDFNPGEPAVLSDWKLSGNEFDLANRVSVLYSLAGTLTEEGCKFPVLIGIPATSDMMELQLHVNIHDTLCKLVVANGKPWDGALLYTASSAILPCTTSSYHSVCNSVSGQLHDTYKLAHMDIRLDNICFNQQFKPILIDLDRSEWLGSIVGQSDYASCMSRKEMSPEKTDWMQLGWMIAWILEPGEDYHDRDFEGLSDNMKETAMLKTLIQEGLGV